MLSHMKSLVSDTLTRERIEESVKRFSRDYYNDKSTVYDLGGVSGYSYRKYFGKYVTVNIDEKEKPDIVADAGHLPFKDNSIDSMLALALLEHVEDPAAVAQEMHRVMKRGGHALVWVPLYWREHKYPADNYRFTRDGITKLDEEGRVQDKARFFKALWRTVLRDVAQRAFHDPQSPRMQKLRSAALPALPALQGIGAG